MKRTTVILLMVFTMVSCTSHAQYLTMEREKMLFLTPKWEGERFEDGRPKVADDIIERMKDISLESAWSVLRNNGYKNQFAGEWKMIYPHEPIVGRVLTAQYMPKRVAVREVLEEKGAEDGRIGDMVSWPIDMLSEGDVYVADSYGKLNEGPIIGDNLGTSIYSKSGNGVIFNGTLRDLEGLSQIEGFNAFVKGWHPSHQMEMMLTGINVPIRIDEVTVLPGDVVLAKREGVVFIPPYLAEEIVIQGEFIALKDEFGHKCLRDGKYTPGQIDARWSDEIREEFLAWLDDNPDKVKMTRERLDEFFKQRTW